MATKKKAGKTAKKGKTGKKKLAPSVGLGSVRVLFTHTCRSCVGF